MARRVLRPAGLRFRYHKCGEVFKHYTTAQRHADEEHRGGRIECDVVVSGDDAA